MIPKLSGSVHITLKISLEYHTYKILQHEISSFVQEIPKSPGSKSCRVPTAPFIVCFFYDGVFAGVGFGTLDSNKPLGIAYLIVF